MILTKSTHETLPESQDMLHQLSADHACGQTRRVRICGDLVMIHGDEWIGVPRDPDGFEGLYIEDVLGHWWALPDAENNQLMVPIHPK